LTFFLQDQGIDENTPGRVSPVSDIPTFMQSAAANKRAFDLETNANDISGNFEKDERQSVVSSVTNILGEEGVMQFLKDAGEYPENVEVFRPELIRQNSRATNALLDHARSLAATDADLWGDVDLSDEGIQSRVNARLQNEYQQAQDIIAMTPEEYTGEALAGGFASALTDIRQAPALLLGAGAGGSLLRLAGREAMINAGLEAALMPSQFDMSERLDIADPNVGQQIALAAAFGATFGLGAGALERGVNAYRMRQAPPQNLAFENMSDADAELFLNQVEDALINGQTPPEAPIATPIVPERIPSEEGPIPPRAPDTMAADIEVPDTIEQALSREVEEASAGVIRRPLSDYLRSPQNATTMDNGQTVTMQIHPEGRAADALRAMGITSRTRPGLFSRNGRKDFDNIVASEMEDLFPGIREAVGDDGRYLDQDGFLRFLADELNGEPVRLRANERLNAAEAQLAEYQQQREVLTRRIDAIEDGLDIQTTQNRMTEIKAHIDEGIRVSGLEGIITDRQRGDMASMMAERGGSVDDLLDAMDDADLVFGERNIGEPDGRPFAPRTADELDTIPDDFRNADELGPGQRNPDGPQQDGRAEAGRASGGGPDQRQIEATPAGNQTLIDGVAPVSQRQRLEAQQDAPMSGGMAAADDGLFDVAGRSQRDMFSDPGNATDMQRAIASDINDQIRADGDFEVGEIEGVQLRNASDVMRYLDEGDAFSARINLCGMGPT
jgi:hypothetical protein